METLNTEDCPRCGCWMLTTDSAAASHCFNCGRRPAPVIRRTEYTDLTAIAFTGVVRCTAGAVVHQHVKPPALPVRQTRKAAAR